MKITFTNTRGTVVFYGGGIHDGFMLTSVTGLDLPERERSLANHAGIDGVTERSAQFGQRIITLYGDFFDAAGKETADYAASILAHKGTLKIDGSEKRREITVDSASFTLGEKKGNYQIFSVQLTCDFPHFTDGEARSQGVYSRINQITAQKALPYVFTQRTGNATAVLNTGDVNTEPVILFEGTQNPGSDAGALIVENKTTEKSMRITYVLQQGELLTLDVPARTLISSLNGNVLSSLDQDSFFSDMYLQPGVNQITVYGEGGNVNMQGVIQFQPLYVEAIV